MAINTGTDQLTYAPAQLNNPVVKPQIFNYANGATMAPTSGAQGLAQGMTQAGASIGKGLQQAGQVFGNAIHNYLNPPVNPYTQQQALLASQQALQMLQQPGQQQNPGMSGFNGLAQQYQNPQQQQNAPAASAGDDDDD